MMAPKRRLSGTRGPKKKRLKGEERHELRSVVRCLTKAGICVDDIVDDVFSPKQKDRVATRNFVNRWSTEEKLSRQNVHDLPRSGRPCSLTPAQKELIPKLLKKIETRNCELISRKWGVSEKVVRNEANKTMRWARRVKKQILTKKQSEERLAFAVYWLKVLEEDEEKFWEVWENALYTDESWFKTHKTQQGYDWIERESGPNFLPNIRGNKQKTNAFGIMSKHVRAIDFQHQTETTKAKTYQATSMPLIAEAADEQENITGERPFVVEDNAPAHLALSTRQLHDELGTRLLTGDEPWKGRLRFPPNANDLNLIENVWHLVKARVDLRNLRSVAELEAAVDDEWKKFPVATFQKLIESVPRRLAAIVVAKGGWTKY
ncbi:hypothetical protein NFJ02_18g30600 [Pycnococcus provasolii]